MSCEESACTPQSVQDRSSKTGSPFWRQIRITMIFLSLPAMLDHRQCLPPLCWTIWRISQESPTMIRTRVDPRGALHILQKPSTSPEQSVPGIDRRKRRRLSLVWRADIRDPVPVSHQANALGSHDQRFLRAPGPQHRLRRVLSEESPEISTLPASTVPASQAALRNRGVELEAVRLFESSSDRGEDSSGPSEMSVRAVLFSR